MCCLSVKCESRPEGDTVVELLLREPCDTNQRGLRESVATTDPEVVRSVVITGESALRR